jgi:hypothetical protein
MAIEVLKKGIILESGSKVKKIHINQHNIRSNKSKDTDLPVITIKIGSKNYYCNQIEIDGPSTIKYCGSGNEKPLINCGARVVMETKSEIKIIN